MEIATPEPAGPPFPQTAPPVEGNARQLAGEGSWKGFLLRRSPLQSVPADRADSAPESLAGADPQKDKVFLFQFAHCFTPTLSRFGLRAPTPGFVLFATEGIGKSGINSNPIRCLRRARASE